MKEYKVRTIICKGCGLQVTDNMRPNQSYCTLDCYRQAAKPERKNGKEVNCEFCDKVFYLPAGRIESADHYFCSIKHANEWQGRNKTDHVCKICGKEFRWSPSRSKAYNVTYCSPTCRDADPERLTMLREMNAKQQALCPNALERTVYSLLDSLCVEYKPQYLIGGKFCVDAFVESGGIVIQFDGDYWHGNPAKFTELDHRQKRRVRLDKAQDAYIKACGYRVVRLWESDIKKSPEHIRQLLHTLLVQP